MYYPGDPNNHQEFLQWKKDLVDFCCDFNLGDVIIIDDKIVGEIKGRGVGFAHSAGYEVDGVWYNNHLHKIKKYEANN